MLQKAISIIIILSLIITGCMNSIPSAEKVLKKMETAESYTNEAKMAVKNNRSIFYYNIKQYYKSPDKYRIEFCDESGVIRQIMIYSNGQCGIFHADIDKPFKTGNFADTKEHNSFISSFLENYKNAPDAKWDLEENDDEKLYVFQCSIVNGNSYFKRAILYVNPKGALPKLLYIFGEDNTKTLEIEYEGFEYDTALDDSIFSME